MMTVSGATCFAVALPISSSSGAMSSMMRWHIGIDAPCSSKVDNAAWRLIQSRDRNRLQITRSVMVRCVAIECGELRKSVTLINDGYKLHALQVLQHMGVLQHIPKQRMV